VAEEAVRPKNRLIIEGLPTWVTGSGWVEARYQEAFMYNVENNFTYHPPKGNQPQRYTALRDIFKGVALVVLVECPDSRERSLALTKLEEAVMWANAAIARNE